MNDISNNLINFQSFVVASVWYLTLKSVSPRVCPPWVFSFKVIYSISLCGVIYGLKNVLLANIDAIVATYWLMVTSPVPEVNNLIWCLLFQKAQDFSLLPTQYRSKDYIKVQWAKHLCPSLSFINKWVIVLGLVNNKLLARVLAVSPD